MEVRARDNAARVLAREELVRWTDYRIDEASGVLWLSRPVPTTTPEGNPVFIVATVERRGGERSTVGGVRLELDASALALAAADSVRFGLTGVRDHGLGAHTLAASDVRVRRGSVEAGAELLQVQTVDSAGTAGRVDAAYRAWGGRLRLTGDWTRVGEGVSSPANARLRSGSEELRLGAEVAVAAGSQIALRHERERFRAFGVERDRTSLEIRQSMGGYALALRGSLLGDAQQGLERRDWWRSGTGRLTLSNPALWDLWMETSRGLGASDSLRATPGQVTFGAGYQLLPGARLEATQRIGRLPGDSAGYAVTGIGLRSQVHNGTEVWGGLERVESAGASHSAVLGWNQRLAVDGGIAVTTLLERRVGLSRAPLADPARALPFAQPNPDGWSAAVGLEILPARETPRLTARGEMRDGEEQRGYRVNLAGDLALGRSAALLTRTDWVEDERLGLAGKDRSRRTSSVLGMALRPVRSDAFNALAKLEWKQTLLPTRGSILGRSGDERRLIGAAEGSWAPLAGTELAARYASRWTAGLSADPAGALELRSHAHFVRTRLEREVGAGWLLRGDAGLLREGASGASRWAAAPSLVRRLSPELEVEVGRRWGTLRDPDFAANGGAGWFALLGVRFTETTAESVAGFWRARLAAGH